MKLIYALTTLMFASCAQMNLNQEDTWFWFLDTKKKENENEVYKSRITYYSIGEDKWGDKVACPKTHRAKEGITVAAHPNFKFGTKVFIPELKGVIGDGYFTVQDRGSAVTKKRAAKGKAYVFDVFVKNQYRMNKHARNRPMYMDTHIIKN